MAMNQIDLKDMFTKIMEEDSSNFKGKCNILKSSWIDSLLGPILAISDEEGLFLLEFIGRRGLGKEIERLKIKTKSVIIPGRSAAIDLVKEELERYFSGKLKEFKTPIHLLGSDFQQAVWKELMRIPCGDVRSYMTQAIAIGKPTGYRAVANANGANQLAIIVPCHRIINSNGNLGGYGGGIEKKKWLIEHEKKFK